MPQPVHEILPGVLHWSAVHPGTGAEASSYLLAGARVAFDPITPPDGIEWFDEGARSPRVILLSNRHHLRDAPALAERFGASIHASRPGMHEFAPEDEVQPFDFGDTLPAGVVAHEIGAICPDETALEVPDAQAVVLADGLHAYDGLGFFSDELLGDDPAAVRRGLVAAYRRLLDEVAFEHVLPAHGPPLVGDGRARLAAFLDRQEG